MTSLPDGIVRHLREVAGQPDLTGTRYRLIGTLGHGGMGTVHLVEDTELGREVALKVLSLPDEAGDLSARLIAEARLLARLEHPNIIPIHDVGRLSDGRVYYAMKYVRGERLDEWRRQGPTQPSMLRLFQRLCGAIAFAHAYGVIHRDLKPENIMVGPFGEALVMDWGVARVIDGPAERGAVIGTPAWMAPEQARGDTDRIDERTDVHALGAILYFLLSGHPPSEEGAGAPGVDRPSAPGRFPGEVPRALRAICLKALSERREDRYASAELMAADVERFLDGHPVTAHGETLLEKAVRIARRNREMALLVLAYILMRALVILLAGT
ncbi:MAG TPA: serine/threonine-protein kinase [Candidatus Polarisedimenticolia bacterium]|jgi:serine/threonine-protein kinase